MGLVLWLRFAPTLRLALAPGAEAQPPFRCRWPFLVLALLAAAWAFFLFRNHQFTVFNTGLWLAATVLGALAFWGKGERQARIRQGGWSWLVVFALFVLAVVFQFSSLDQIPANPWSDHTEKLEDIHDLAEGQYAVFFPRNTGREAFQFYWTYLVGLAFGTGVSFYSLKLGTALLGVMTSAFVFLLARVLGGPRLALAALYIYAIAFWPNILSRIGLRFPLYPLFTAAFLFFLFRALSQQRQSDWVFAGISLGLGLHGYSPFRVVPLLAVLLVLGFYVFHRCELNARRAAARIAGLAFLAFLVFLPLARFAWDRPDLFWYRATTRWASAERPLVQNPLATFAHNVVRALAMFNWDEGELFAISVPHRPALDAVTATLFLLGVAMALRNVLRQRSFVELALLVGLVVLQLPSTLSLAFPNENPAPNRAGAAAIPAIILAAWAASMLWKEVSGLGGRRRILAFGLLLGLAVFSAVENWTMVMRYGANNRLEQFDTPAMAAVIEDFLKKGGSIQDVHIVRVPHWVDTRLPALLAGIPHRDLGVDREELRQILVRPTSKLLFVKDDDQETQELLKAAAFRGATRGTNVPGRHFWVFTSVYDHPRPKD
ncbi:glycosyltransferase family 39 protein [Thermoanaerobaculum aquaticum]|nr:glycosyltransferase family 39 protein [Thermoanaerobaculum aquaticum]